MPNGKILKTHYRSPHPTLNIPRWPEDLGTDTFFLDTPALDGGQTCAQIYAGHKSRARHAYSMKSEKQFINTLEDCVDECGTPD